MTGWLDRAFPLPASSARRRPDEFVHGVADRPPLPLLLGMGLQHGLLGLIFALYAVICAQAMGYDTQRAAGFVSATVLVLGCGTVLQSLPTRFGAGLPLVFIPSPARLPLHIAIVLHDGLGALMGATLVSGIATVLLARAMPRLRPVFPPEVTGVAVLMLGVSLVTGAVSRSVGLGAGVAVPSGAAVLAAGATVACMVGIAIWGSARWRRVALLAGAVAGTLVTALTVGLPSGATLAAVPPVALPVLGLDLPWPEFRLVPILVVLVSQVITMMDQVGGTLSMDRMTDADWRRADMPLVARSMTGLGLTQILSGLTGTLGGATSSANIGLVHASGIAARGVGLVAGAVLVGASFLPPVAALLALTPQPVVGGILLYTAAYMIATGMDLIMSRMMNARRSFTVGLAIVLGTAVMLVPQLGQSAPEWSRVVVASGLTVAALAAVGLNALFRIGVRQDRRAVLDPAREAREAAELLEAGGKDWGVRQDTVLRAAHVVGEALEALRADGLEGPVTLGIAFDEFTLVSTLSYQGEPLRLGPGAALDPAALEDEDALDRAMRQVSALLITRLADRVRAGGKGGTAELVLVLDH